MCYSRSPEKGATMNSKPIRYHRKISFSCNHGPHRGPYAWEIEPTPQEADERKRHLAERALLNSRPLAPVEIAAVMGTYRRNLEQMSAIAIEISEITSIAKIAEAVGVSESQLQLLIQRNDTELSLEEILKVITACRSVIAFDFGY